MEPHFQGSMSNITIDIYYLLCYIVDTLSFRIRPEIHALYTKETSRLFGSDAAGHVNRLASSKFLAKGTPYHAC